MNRWNLSGRDMNKFQVAGLTPIPAVAVKPPRIAECLTLIECWIIDTLETGDQAVDKSAGDVHNGRCGHAGTALRARRGQP
jgi:flavin reductase (DIM6/NTAB) family NADH-FMN oxidoreductase RutF